MTWGDGFADDDDDDDDFVEETGHDDEPGTGVKRESSPLQGTVLYSMVVRILCVTDV